MNLPLSSKFALDGTVSPQNASGVGVKENRKLSDVKMMARSSG